CGPGASTRAEHARLPEGNPDDLPPLDDPSRYSYPARLRAIRSALPEIGRNLFEQGVDQIKQPDAP
ncbi:MAG: hypothetical protein ACREJ0_27055, partial [Geminicoccaceae bacterium]